MELETRISRGSRAKEILDSDIYLGAFAEIKQEILEQWEQSPARDEQGREKLYLMLAMLAKVQVALTRVMDTGKLAQVELGHQRSQQERQAEYLGLD
ncbi:MAG TPA: hypothetical protein VIE69_07540 [Methylophilaceae bacterium]|jgi:cytochrome c-type biogenesis protein CcmH/NrfG